jgi:Tfp pilus assembly PilM family ATPase
MIEDHLHWEVEQGLVGPPDDYFIEHQKLPFHTADGNPYYVLAYVRKQAVFALKSMLEKSKLELKNVDIDVFSAIRTLSYAYSTDENEGVSVLIDIHREYLCFIFIQNGEFLLSHRMTLLEDKNQDVFRDHSEMSDVLVKELKRLVFGHRLGRGIGDLKKAYLFGTESVNAVAQDLSASIPIPVEVANPFQRLQLSEKVKMSKDYAQYPERFVASIGTILEHVPNPQP